jgi:transcriptional regulator with XRE-family HTH domain
MTGTELRRLRKRAGLTQRALAERLGMNANHVAGMEQGRVPVREVVALAVRYVTAVPQPKGGRHHER